MITFFYEHPLRCEICGEDLESWMIGQTHGSHIDCSTKQFGEEIERIIKKHLKAKNGG